MILDSARRGNVGFEVVQTLVCATKQTLKFMLPARQEFEELLRENMPLAPMTTLGIGGPARYFAAEHQCKVTGIDLTEEFVQVARSLTRRARLEHLVDFVQASAAPRI